MIKNGQNSRYEFSLTISRIGIRVISNNSKLVEALHRRYQEFSGDSEPHLKVNVQYEGHHRTSALLDTGLIFKDRICKFTAPGYDGFIDVGKERGDLKLSSVQPVEDVDYFLRVAYALLAFEAGGLLFHAAGVVRNGWTFLFFGHSGSGKTTVARLSKNDIVLNDDLVMLLPDSQGSQERSNWVAYATPFWNPTQVRPTPHSAPCAGLYRLVQDRDVFLEPMSQGQALAEMVSNVPVIPDDPTRNSELLKRGMDLLGAMPAYLLHFLPDDSFWDAVESAFEN